MPDGSPKPGGTESSSRSTRLGRFQIVRELGCGGHGIVYLAWDPQLGREVALKLPRPDVLRQPGLQQRLLREARLAAGLDHPALVRLYELGQAGPVWYLVSAYCPGESLAAWLRRRATPVSATDAAGLVATLAGAVEYIHRRQIVHRDIKPANVILEADAARRETHSHQSLAGLIPKLTDFGLAKLQEAETEPTVSGALLGTLEYMAPEQAQGRLREVGPQTDVYGLGAVLYELLTGQPPFRGRTKLETLRQVASETPAMPSAVRRDLPRDLESICLKCLEHSPCNRYQSAAALAADLHRFLRAEPVRARQVGPVRRMLMRFRRRPGAVTLPLTLGVALTAGYAAGWWQWHRTGADDQPPAQSRQLGHELDRAHERLPDKDSALKGPPTAS